MLIYYCCSMPSFKDKPKKYFKDRKTFRLWLEKNWDKSDGIWAIIHKKNSSKSSISYTELVQECICYGWIDSLINKYNEEAYIQYITPRKSQSPWSRINKNYVEQLEKVNLIANPGKEKIKQAKKDGSWEIYDEIEDLVIPKDLQKELNKNKAATENWNNTSDSVKKGFLWNLKTAKSEDTRKRRIDTIIEKTNQGKLS